jgi:hypothetical protein
VIVAKATMGRWLRMLDRLNREALLAGLLVLQVLAMTIRTEAGSFDAPCPAGAISIEPGGSIQAAVEEAGEGAGFCLKNGIHRLQVVRPKAGQSFHGQGQTILNGSRLLTSFSREGRYWVATGQQQRGRKRGRCAKEAWSCSLPEAVFLDDRPLTAVPDKERLEAGMFYFDYPGDKIYLADDPAGRKVEATVGAFAFGGTAPNVRIRNIIVEKYSSVAQEGAIQAQRARAWIVEDCEARLNSAGGIGVGTGSQVRGCDVHHNGQIGIAGNGGDIVIERNRIWANNTRGFSHRWEAGGVKIAATDGVVLRGNHVHDNLGPGLWCDINCYNVLYEHNAVERNHGAGIFHEISFNATIRNNLVRHNGAADNNWLWGNDILVAGSQDVEVYGNILTVSPGKCGIMLIDQGRLMEGLLAGRGKYKTRNNQVYDNVMTFDGSACAGGASDAVRGDENFSIIMDGNNVFDRNVYRVPRTSGDLRFVWGHVILDWDGLQSRGIERNGRLIQY